MKRAILLAVMSVFICMTANAQLIWEDRFEYEPSSLLEGQGDWELGTGEWTSGFSPKVADCKLEYPGYVASGSGTVSIGGTGVNRLTYKVIDPEGLNKGNLYVAMMINMESVDGTRDFITLDSGTGSSPKVKIFLRKAGSGFSVGASMSSPKNARFSHGLAFRVPHLIVLKYTFMEAPKDGAADCNDKISVYVNPVPELAENKQLAVWFAADRMDKSSDPKKIKSLNIRQNGAKGYIGGLRVARTWDAAVKK